MTKTTRAQRVALKAVFDRGPVYSEAEKAKIFTGEVHAREVQRLTYQQFRRTIQPTFGMDSAIVVRWYGMWLCIEADGYVHS